MTEITKDTVIGDILDICPDAAPYFLQMGMHCLGCPASRGETVEQACAVHGVDTDDLLEQIKEAFDAQRISIPYPQMEVTVRKS